MERSEDLELVNSVGSSSFPIASLLELTLDSYINTGAFCMFIPIFENMEPQETE